MHINGYPYDLLDEQVFSKFSKLISMDDTASLVKRLNEIEDDKDKVLFISLGENCAVGQKLKNIGFNYFGGNFFDNIVSSIPSTCLLFENRFIDLFRLKYLSISSWEGHDSVHNNFYDIFFHHYFHARGAANEKSRYEGEKRIREISPADIMLFLPIVQSQFERFIDKMSLLLSSDVVKVFLIRKVDGGDDIDEETLDRLTKAITSFGGRNFSINVITNRENSQLPCSVYIPDSFDAPRWGQDEDWKKALHKLILDGRV